MAEETTLTNDNTNEDEVMFSERKRWLFFGLPFTFTKYTISPSLVTIKQGLLNTTEDDCYMYKIQDVKLSTSFFERIFGLGTITCYTGDITNPELKLTHIKLFTIGIEAHCIHHKLIHIKTSTKAYCTITESQ